MKTYDQARTGAVLRARQLRRDSTEAEKLLWRALREAFPAIKRRRQMPVGPYFVDFACFAQRLIVELDGGQHAVTAGQDATRTRFLERQGYRVLRFWNNDVLGNTDGVIESIALTLSRLCRSSLSHREREGGAQRRKGEADNLPSNSHFTPSPNPLPRGEGLAEQ